MLVFTGISSHSAAQPRSIVTTAKLSAERIAAGAPGCSRGHVYCMHLLAGPNTNRRSQARSPRELRHPSVWQNTCIAVANEDGIPVLAELSLNKHEPTALRACALLSLGCVIKRTAERLVETEDTASSLSVKANFKLPPQLLEQLTKLGSGLMNSIDEASSTRSPKGPHVRESLRAMAAFIHLGQRLSRLYVPRSRKVMRTPSTSC